jgi:hypothetical protein
MMAELGGQIGELRFTLEIKRKETGKVEIVEMVGFVDEAKLKEFQDGGYTFDSSPQRSD